MEVEHAPVGNGDASFANGATHLPLDVLDPKLQTNGVPEYAEIPDFGEINDFTAEDMEVVDDPAEVVDAPAEDIDGPLTAIYMVRIPRPFADDTLIKKLQEKFQAAVDEVKKRQADQRKKREELGAVRNELGVARSLKFGANPAFSDKNSGYRALADQKSAIISEIQQIRDGVKGMECRSEAELDEKILNLEKSIQYDNLSLREEKQAVANISKLKSQRETVRRFEGQNSMLTELEARLQGVKAQMGEMKGEVGVLKGEKEQAEKIFKDIDAKYNKKKTEIEELDALVAKAQEKKEEALKQLNTARADYEHEMQEFWDYKRFSTKVRDMVLQGQVEDAAAMTSQQMEEQMERLCTDVRYRAEYFKLWKERRMYQVSALLPDSSVSTSESAAKGGKPGAPAAKGAPAAAAKGKPAAKPQPAAPKFSASDLIEQALAAASKQAREERGRAAPVQQAAESDESEEEEKPKAFEPSALKAPAVYSRGGTDSVFSHKVVVPTIPDDNFVVPVAARGEDDKGDSLSKEEKERLREENRIKQAEAELRKRKRQEVADKKRQAALEAARKAGEDRKKGKSKEPEYAADSGAEATGVDTATSAAEITDNDAEPAPVNVSLPRSRGSKPSKASIAAHSSETEEVATRGRPRPVRKDKNKLKKFWKQYGGYVVAAIVTVLIILMALLYVFAMRR